VVGRTGQRVGKAICPARAYALSQNVKAIWGRWRWNRETTAVITGTRRTRAPLYKVGSERQECGIYGARGVGRREVCRPHKISVGASS